MVHDVTSKPPGASECRMKPNKLGRYCILSAVDGREIDLAQAFGVCENVDLDDLRASNGEPHDRKWAPLRKDDDSDIAIDQGVHLVKRKPTEGRGTRRHSVRAPHQD